MQSCSIVWTMATFVSETPDTPKTQGWDAACVRIVTWGKFYLCASQQEIFVYNTQLDHVGQKSREESSKLLWERMLQIAGDAPLFIPPHELVQLLHLSRMRTTATRSLARNGEADWRRLIQVPWLGWFKNDDEKMAVRAANHIDWIFFRLQMIVLTTEVITEDRNGNYPSDHYPIQTEVLFPSPAKLPPPQK